MRKMFLKWSVRPRVRAMCLMTANACVIYSMTTSLTQRVQIDLLGSAAIWSLPFPPFRLSVPFSPYHLLFSCSFLLSHTFHSAHFFPAFHLSVPLKRPLFHIKGFFRVFTCRGDGIYRVGQKVIPLVQCDICTRGITFWPTLYIRNCLRLFTMHRGSKNHSITDRNRQQRHTGQYKIDYTAHEIILDTRGICCHRVSVRLSVRLSHADVVSKRLNLGSRKQRRTIAQGL